jgi:hypothetical protein
VLVQLKYQHIHNHLTTDQTLCLVLLQPTVAVVADLGTAMQVVQAEVVAVDALDQTAPDQTATLDQTIVEIKITAVEVS